MLTELLWLAGITVAAILLAWVISFILAYVCRHANAPLQRWARRPATGTAEAGARRPEVNTSVFLGLWFFA